jgi:hypothetical protein
MIYPTVAFSLRPCPIIILPKNAYVSDHGTKYE